jgi:hypothetical protein
MSPLALILPSYWDITSRERMILVGRGFISMDKMIGKD